MKKTKTTRKSYSDDKRKDGDDKQHRMASFTLKPWLRERKDKLILMEYWIIIYQVDWMNINVDGLKR